MIKNLYLRRVYLLLLTPPVLFLLIIVAVSIYFGIVTQGNSQAITEQTTRAAPYMLLAVQVLMLLMLLRVLRIEGKNFLDIGWKLSEKQRWWQEVLIGIVAGVILGFLYIFLLSPFLTMLQRTVGDYIPPGEILTTLGSAIIPFFIANVLLAPLVEESLYRGYAFPRLRERFGQLSAFLITCILFGLLHWTGGFWYILLTGLIAGGVFTGLAIWRGNIVMAYVAHLALNLVEFLLTR